MKRFLLPFGLFIALTVFLYVGLHRDPREIPSPLINKPAPQFTLSQLADPDKTISAKDMLGKVWILNVWASWCSSCQIEHPAWVAFVKQYPMPIIGLNTKDDRNNARQWLARLGDPYLVSAFDDAGNVAIDYGVYGAPETYLIDKQGIIRYKHIGPVTPEVINEQLLPMIKELNGA